MKSPNDVAMRNILKHAKTSHFKTHFVAVLVVKYKGKY